MGLSRFSVRCIKQLSPEAIDERLSEIIAASYTEHEEADLLLITAHASMWGF